MRMFMLICCALALTTGALAESKAAPKDPVEELKCLLGSWQGKGEFTAGAERAQVQVRYECEESAGGAGVKCRGEMTGIPGMASYRWDDLWGYDPGDDSLHWFTVTNAGETHDHAGKLAKRAFEGRFTGKREGKAMVEDVSFRFDKRDRVRVSSSVKIGGEQAEEIRVTLEKHNG